MVSKAKSSPGVTARSESGATPISAGQVRHGMAACFEQPGEPVEIVDEPALAFVGRRSAEPCMGVGRGKQGQRDAGFGSRPRYRRCHLRRIGIAGAVRLMIEIVELADACEAGLQHLDERHRGDRGDVVGREAGRR